MKKLVAGLLWWILVVPGLHAEEPESKEHFIAGQVRAGLNWDNISAMETGVLKFGGTAGIFVVNGLELGYEQLFVVPPEEGSQSRSYGYMRVVPFRSWPINPFFSMQVGYFSLPDVDALSLGTGLGLVMFIDRYFAFEARITAQSVFHPQKSNEDLIDFDWRFVVYF